MGDWVGAFNHTGDLVAEYDVGGDAALAGGPITVQVHGGEVYILGSDNERIVVMGTDGSPRRHWGGPGTEPGKFEDLCDVVVTDNYVLTAERAGRYQVFDHSGNHLREFTSVVDSDCAVSVFNDEIYSISSDRGIVVVLDMDGELLREFGEGVLFQPIAIEVSASGLVWVGGHHENIHAMTPSGDVVETISGFEVLHALTVDGSDHALWTFHHRRHRNGGRGTNHVDVFTDLSCGGRRIEVLGTAYGDVIALGETHDIVHAGGGDDTVAAGPGPDYVCGGDGADDLAGGFGDDFLYGGDGLDTLRGGPGEDFCDGGEADVTFGCELPGG